MVQQVALISVVVALAQEEQLGVVIIIHSPQLDFQGFSRLISMMAVTI
jgi:hypothetical protein